MRLQRHLDALADDLERIAAVGDDAVVEATHRLTAALGASLRVRLLDVLAEAAAELTGSLPIGHVDVRLAGGDPEFVFRDDEPAAERPGEPGEEFAARITLRLPDSLKTQVEAAALRDGVSVNSWVVSALARGVSTEQTRRGTSGTRRLTGYGRS
jgi:hypothetical protein